MRELKIAIVHDYHIHDGGGNVWLNAVHQIYPEAPVYMLFHDPEKTGEMGLDVRSTFLDKIPLLKKNHIYFLPLFPLAVRSIRLSGYDAVLTSSWAWSNSLKTEEDTCHICYCHTPMRFAYDMREPHLRGKNQAVKFFSRILFDLLKWWDLRTAGRPDHYIANSEHVRERIKKCYNRDSTVIHPPVDTDRFKISKKEGDYYLLVSRLTPYKRADLAVEAFNRMGLPLKVAGDGPEYERLRRLARPNVEMIGHVPDEHLPGLYQGCKALVFPQLEDWGNTSLEAQSCGKPVIAYGMGGAAEHVVDGVTGVFFKEQTGDALAEAVRRFQNLDFDPDVIRNNALQYSVGPFKEKLRSYVEEKTMDFKLFKKNQE
ncbi:MAG: glycosyltransferase [Candidatus Altiarchaeales archaeon]|nr:glycosyltransferase [Candidatus Altiarchaeales archaeon]MBD3415512.1 glycosyltransferase [Candidatus Altiarchaeales archaeon]